MIVTDIFLRRTATSCLVEFINEVVIISTFGFGSSVLVLTQLVIGYLILGFGIDYIFYLKCLFAVHDSLFNVITSIICIFSKVDYFGINSDFFF